MSAVSFDADLAVATLVEAWRSGTQIDALPEAARPRSVAEGYDIQDLFVAAIDTGWGGWKLGVGSHKARAAAGHGRSIAGRVLHSRMHAAGDVVLLPDTAPVTIEIELAFVLSRDVAPGDAIADPKDAVGESRLTAELVRSRFRDRRAVGWPSFAADNAGFEALVVGPVIDGGELARLRSTLSVTVDGRPHVRAAIGDDITDPWLAFADLIALARERRILLPAGTIVSTGSQSVPFDLTEGATVVARCFDAELTFSTRTA